MTDRATTRELLRALNQGDITAWNQLLPIVYDELRRQAHAIFRGERNTLQATAVLHEALADLISADLTKLQFEGPGRFFALVSRMIRNKLHDHIRQRRADKRGGALARVSLESISGDVPDKLHCADATELHEALEQLREYDERLWMITELKFFGKMSNREIAESLGLGLSTIENDWTFAKAWLQRELRDNRES